MGSLGWAPAQYDWCSYKMGKFWRQTCTQGKRYMKMKSDWGDASRRTPKIASEPSENQATGMGPSLSQPTEENSPADTLILDFKAPKP